MMNIMLMGFLQYLTMTRPEISYYVNQISQFLQVPTSSHMEATSKRILRFVKGTIMQGIHFTKSRSHILQEILMIKDL